MAYKVLIFCASALFLQAAAGHLHKLPSNLVNYGLSGGSGVTSRSAATAAAGNTAASTTAASAAGANRGAVSSSTSAASTLEANAGASSVGTAVSSASAVSTESTLIPVSFSDNIIYDSLLVRSSSPLHPSGLYFASKNTLQGLPNVAGSMPFLSAMPFEAVLPVRGSSVASCGCGSDKIGIVKEKYII